MSFKINKRNSKISPLLSWKNVKILRNIFFYFIGNPFGRILLKALKCFDKRKKYLEYVLNS